MWDDRELFQIGDVARMFRISVGSLRHYEKMGLLSPEYIDGRTGYRYYSASQFECLNTIRYLRTLDVPLEQIGEFLANRDVDRMQDMLRQQKDIVVRRQEALRIIEKKIDNRLKEISDALESELDKVYMVQTPSRRIAWLRNDLSPKTYLDLEASIRQLEQGQRESLVFLGKIGVGIGEERLRAASYDSYDMVFILLDAEDVYEGRVEVLPEQTCAALRFRGGHRDAQKHYIRLAKYMAEQGVEVSGFSREVTMIDDGMTGDRKKFVTEIQIPVRPVA